MKKIFCLTILLFTVDLFCIAQPFANEIDVFKKQDRLHFPENKSILFVGSSSFRKWENMQSYFPSHKLINRGFGGSTLLDVIRYENDIIFPYNPKQIIIYCGENDLASSDSVTAKVVFERFKILFYDIRFKLPKVPILFVSLKPSPSRWHLKDKQIEANKLIKKFLNKKKRSYFINIWNAMLDANGLPNHELFIDDKLHTNNKGYQIWQKIIEPYLD